VKRQTEDIAAQSRQLASQLQQLQDQQVMLEEDNAIKARLIGIISHDLISPLKFMGYMGMKLKGDFRPGESGYQTAEYITTVARELESLSVNILNWIRFHHNSVAMQPERFDLQELVAESTEIASALASEKGVAFHNELPSGIVIDQYRQAIGVIVYNLAMNAVKHTATGAINISAAITDREISITVADSGTGMPPELVKQLNTPDTMMPGYTGEEEKKYQFGYVIIKDLLRLINGALLVESRVGEGTSVRVTVQLIENARKQNAFES
jgi:signal transduction histidine kinase